MANVNFQSREALNEFMKMQENFQQTQAKLRQVKKQHMEASMAHRKSGLTLEEINSLPEGSNTYRAVGKIFMQKPVDAIREELVEVAKKSESQAEILAKSKTYLESQIEDVTRHMGELIKAQSRE